MSIRGRIHIGSDETLRISLPGFAGKDVEYTIDVPGAGKNGANIAHLSAGGAVRGNEMTPDTWKKFVEGLEGAIEDPTFVRPPQGEYEEREPLD